MDTALAGVLITGFLSGGAIITAAIVKVIPPRNNGKYVTEGSCKDRIARIYDNLEYIRKAVDKLNGV